MFPASFFPKGFFAGNYFPPVSGGYAGIDRGRLATVLAIGESRNRILANAGLSSEVTANGNVSVSLRLL